MIFYFTGTGNSQHVAKKLGAALNDRVVNITDAFRKKEYSYELSEGEKVGFVYPVFFYGAPTIVTDFIDRMQLRWNVKPYLYTVLTYGGSTGGAGLQLQQILMKKGYPECAVFSLLMPGNYVIGYKTPDEDKQQRMLTEADHKLKTIIEVVKKSGKNEYAPGLPTRMITALAYPLYLRGRKTKKFYAEDNCTGCGLCANVCPCSAIQLTEAKPEWKSSQCIHCLACINRCPVRAIQYGNKTKSRGRYVHPDLKSV